MSSERRHRFATRAVHDGQGPDPGTGAHATPIYQTSTFSYGSHARGAALFSGDAEGYLYSRIGNPTTRAFETKIASLEGTEDAVAFASGMGAISALMLSLLRPGDEILTLGPLYGGTDGLLRDVLAPYGIRRRDVDDTDLPGAISPATRMIYLETPTNPTLTIHDLDLVAASARGKDILTVADNTFATPYLTRPVEHGIDVVVHSATKYLGGHGDVVAGVIAGPAELVTELRSHGLRHVGAVLGAFESFLLLRGVKTLPIRMERHCDNAEALARGVLGHPAVAAVHYPGLPEHPQHALAGRQMARFGGMLALELHGGAPAAARFLDRLTLFTQAVSLGDVESLATHPASTTHQLLEPEARNRHSISDGLVRLSVGIEDGADLLDDVLRALDAVRASDAPATTLASGTS
ncbi:MAG: PLP-dependent aspartate aminotransferase family protein [Deinococcales bacterium]|jgi:methionine-gamma-lyase